MFLKYPALQYINGEFLYTGRNDSMIRTHGPRVCENIIQALARIVITDQILTTHQLPGVDVVLTVHDEIIAEAPEGSVDLNHALDLMKITPFWAGGLPLAADGWIAKRFKK